MEINQLIFQNNRNTTNGSNGLINVNKLVHDQRMRSSDLLDHVEHLGTVNHAILHNTLYGHRINKGHKTVHVDRLIVYQPFNHRVINKSLEAVHIDRIVGNQLRKSSLSLNQVRKLLSSVMIVGNKTCEHVLFLDEIHKFFHCFIIGKHSVDDSLTDICKIRIVKNYLNSLVHKLLICLGIIFFKVAQYCAHRLLVDHATHKHDICGIIDVNNV